MYYDPYLAHYGVKGMKWGVHRYQNKDGSLTAAGKKKYKSQGERLRAKNPERYEAVQNYRKIKIQKAPSSKDAPHGAATKNWWKNAPVDVVARRMDREVKDSRKYGNKIRKEWVGIHNAAADVNNPKLNKLNKKYEGVDFKKDRKAYKQYVKEYVDSWNNDLVSEVKNRFGDAPDIVTTDDILSLLPTAISQEDAQHIYESFYED